MPQNFVGVDIAKGWIDAFFLSTSRHERIITTKQYFTRFATAVMGSLVICEASDGYERLMIEALAKQVTGLAPLATDSGLHRGKRHIWGGPASARAWPTAGRMPPCAGFGT
ncbi:MAG: hypothetical protein WCC57_00595 [Paracoccaceae bacterium]